MEIRRPKSPKPRAHCCVYSNLQFSRPLYKNTPRCRQITPQTSHFRREGPKRSFAKPWGSRRNLHLTIPSHPSDPAAPPTSPRPPAPRAAALLLLRRNGAHGRRRRRLLKLLPCFRSLPCWGRASACPASRRSPHGQPGVSDGARSTPASSPRTQKNGGATPSCIRAPVKLFRPRHRRIRAPRNSTRTGGFSRRSARRSPPAHTGRAISSASCNRCISSRLCPPPPSVRAQPCVLTSLQIPRSAGKNGDGSRKFRNNSKLVFLCRPKSGGGDAPHGGAASLRLSPPFPRARIAASPHPQAWRLEVAGATFACVTSVLLAVIAGQSYGLVTREMACALRKMLSMTIGMIQGYQMLYKYYGQHPWSRNCSLYLVEKEENCPGSDRVLLLLLRPLLNALDLCLLPLLGATTCTDGMFFVCVVMFQCRGALRALRFQCVCQSRAYRIYMKNMLCDQRC